MNKLKDCVLVYSSLVPVLFIAIVTAYSSYETCPDGNCIMANGEQAYIGAIACPRSLKFGSRVEIAGKEYICADRTAKRYNGRFDIFIGYGKEAHTKALKFGKQKLEVKIIK